MAGGTPGFTSYSIDNDKAFRNALDRAAQVVDDLRIPFTLIASDFYRSQRAIFSLKSPGQYPDLSTKPFFARWEEGDLKRYYPGGYKEYKTAKVGFEYPILKRNGFLEVAASVQKGPGNITEIGEKELIMGVDEEAVPYAIFHQSDKPRKRIPLRKFLFIGPEAKRFATSDQMGRLERWLGIINGFLAEKLNQSGAGDVKK